MLPGQRETEPATAARYAAEGFWTGCPITEYLERAVASSPRRPAVVDDRFGSITYAALARQVERLACGLLELGFSRGDCFIVQLPNWHIFSVFHLALTAIGALTVNVPVTYRQHELRSIVRATGARGWVVPAAFRSFDYAGMVGALRPEWVSLRAVFVVGNAAGTPFVNYHDFMARPWERGGRRRTLDPLRPAPDEVTAVSFTSGTTGEPKGVMHTSNTFAAINVSVARAYGLTAEDVIFMAAPLGHSIGLMHGVRLALFLGGTLVLQEQWSPAGALGLIARERASFTALAPPFLHDLVFDPALGAGGPPPAFRVCLCGGAFVSERLLRAARERLPHTLSTALWGITEGIGTACRIGTAPAKLLATDGQPFPGSELKIAGPDGQELPRGREGELLLRGPQVFVGYFGRPDLNAEAFLPDGFFRTGDLATMDGEGFLRITGRLKDIIVRGGVNISPVEIERALAEDPRVERVAIVGMPDERLGERVCAFVVPRAGGTITLPELAAIAERRGLAKHKWPERVECVSHIPVTPSGKILRHVLKEWLSAGRAPTPQAASAPGPPAGEGHRGDAPSRTADPSEERAEGTRECDHG